MVEQLRRVAKVEPGLERRQVGCPHLVVLGETLVDPLLRALDRAGVEQAAALEGSDDDKADERSRGEGRYDGSQAVKSALQH